MRKILMCALLLLPAALAAQELTGAELDEMPGLKGSAAEAGAEPVQRPDPQRMMAELSSALRLSSKQEERIGAAVKKKAAEFDKLLKEYERNSEEEKRWRFKANEARYGMVRINRGLPDVVREFLDDEQRESYDAMLEPRKPGRGPAAAAREGGAPAPAPARKKKVLKRKKAPAPAAAPEAGPEGEEGGVMVDGEAPRPAPRKKVLKRKKAPAPAPAPEEPPAEPETPAEPEAPAEEDAASYP